MQSAPQPRARLIDWTHHGTVERASSLPPVPSMEEGSTGKKCGRRSVSVTRAEVTDERLCFIREYMALKAITKQDMEEFDNGGYMPPHRKISNHPYVVGAAEAMKEFKKTGKEAEIIAFNNILSMMTRLRVASEEQIAVKSKKEDLEKELNQLKAEEKKKGDEIEAAWQQY